VTTTLTKPEYSRRNLGAGSLIGVLKEILNQLSERAEAAVDRSRLAALPLRCLDDASMTVGERAAILGYEEPARDPWALVAIQRL
jgi:hypothetical protein